MSLRPVLLSASDVADLIDLAGWLLDKIDGGEECRGRDSQISMHVDTINRILDQAGNRPAEVEHGEHIEL